MITDSHRNFARAVVAAARVFGIGTFSISFGLSWRNRESGRDTFGRVTMSWSEGRHGEPNPIKLDYEAHETISEQVEERINE